MNKCMEKQEFTTPANWSTFDVARLKLHATKFKFYDFCTIMFLDKNLRVWKEDQSCDTVGAEVVAYCRVFERVDISEWLDAEGEAEDMPTGKLF